MKNLDELFPVTEYDANHALELNEYNSIKEDYINGEWIPRDGETLLKPGQTIDKDGYAKLWGLHGLDLIRNDEPFFMGYGRDGEAWDDLFDYLVAAGVILEDELAHKDPRRWLEATHMALVFRRKRDGVLFIERLNAFMHRKREKLLDFILYRDTEQPCGICGEKPSLKKSLACEDCVEGGTK